MYFNLEKNMIEVNLHLHLHKSVTHVHYHQGQQKEVNNAKPKGKYFKYLQLCS